MTRRRPVCVPLTGDDGQAIGFAYTAGPITDADRAAVNHFRQILRDAYQELHDMTEPDQTSPTPPPTVEVDLTEAGVSGWVFVLHQIAAKKAALDEAEADARAHIEAALGDNVDGVIDGKPAVRWSHVAGRRTFDKTTFAKTHPDMAEQYTKVGQPSRRFELIKPKGDA